MPRASVADRRQSPPLTALSPTTVAVSGGDWRLSIILAATPRFSSDLGLLAAKLPKMGDSPPRTPLSLHAKFDAACFILAEEIRNRTNTHTHTHTQTNKQHPRLAYRHCVNKT